MQVAASMAGLAFALALFLTNLVADGAEVQVDGGVLLLEGDNFDIALKKYNALMVFFYSPNVKKSAEYYEAYKKAAKKVKKLTNNTARMAKVDVTTDGGRQIPYRFKIMEYPTLAAFKGGELETLYAISMHEKEEYIDFMLAINGPKALFYPRYFYIEARAYWKKFMRLTPASREIRKITYDGFPVILGLMFVIPLASYWCCCRGTSDYGESEAPPKGEAVKAADPKEAHEGEEKAPKTENEKKEE